MANDTVTRRVHFFVPRDGQDNVVNLRPLVAHVATLSDMDRIVRLDDENSLYAVVDKDRYPMMLQLAVIRFGQLPQRARRGKFMPLQLAADEGLAEISHIVVFKTGVTVAEFNFRGPRLSRLPFYFQSLIPNGTPDFAFDPVWRRDQIEKLNRMRLLRSVQLRFPAGLIEQNGLLSQLKNLTQTVGAGTVEVVFKPERHSRDTLSPGARDVAKELFSNKVFRDSAYNLTVTGYDPAIDSVDVVDLLQGRISERVDVPRLSPTSRAVSSRATYEALTKAYNSREAELVDAAFGAGARP